MLKLKLQYFGHLMWRTDSLEKSLMLGKIEGGRRRGQQRMRWLDGTQTQWKWVWVNSGSWWWTQRPGMLQSMGLLRVGHDWATELNCTGPQNVLKIYSAQYQYKNKQKNSVLIHINYFLPLSFPGGSEVKKHLPGMRETWVRSLGWEDPLEKEMATHSSTLAWRIHGGRSLVGYSLWGRKESDTTERLHSLKVKVKLLTHVWLFVTPWTIAYQTPLFMEFSRQEYWSGLPFPSPGDLPDPGIEPGSPTFQADALPSEPPGKLFHLKLIFFLLILKGRKPFLWVLKSILDP